MTSSRPPTRASAGLVRVDWRGLCTRTLQHSSEQHLAIGGGAEAETMLVWAKPKGDR